jgi:glyoxylase-like metal-dependent hydrolase (beta-lactamase superfamily II)/ferredoxin
MNDTDFVTSNDAAQGAIDRSVWTITSTCRRCRAAWNLAPSVIGTGKDGKAFFRRQPETEPELMEAWRAAVACPTGSIKAPHGIKMPDGIFPQLLAENLWRLGYNDNSSAGAHPFFIRSKSGLNFMVDGPRFVPRLVKFIEEQGGLDHVLLTHRDDVGSSAKYAEHFGARLWIHENDREASPEATDILKGYEISEPIPGCTVIPIPGHTIGSVAFLIDEKLFPGDSLGWELAQSQLWTNPIFCWDDWDMQRRALRRLQDFRFDYVCAGHNYSIGFPADRMKAELDKALDMFDTLTWTPPTHLPTGAPIPEARIQERDRRVALVRADFFATLAAEK